MRTRCAFLLLDARDVLPRGDNGFPIVHEDRCRTALFIEGNDAPLTVLSNDAVAYRRRVLCFFHLHAAAAAVAVTLVFQAAHETTADA